MAHRSTFRQVRRNRHPKPKKYKGEDAIPGFAKTRRYPKVQLVEEKVGELDAPKYDRAHDTQRDLDPAKSNDCFLWRRHTRFCPNNRRRRSEGLLAEGNESDEADKSNQVGEVVPVELAPNFVADGISAHGKNEADSDKRPHENLVFLLDTPNSEVFAG